MLYNVPAIGQIGLHKFLNVMCCTHHDVHMYLGMVHKAEERHVVTRYTLQNLPHPRAPSQNHHPRTYVYGIAHSTFLDRQDLMGVHLKCISPRNITRHLNDPLMHYKQGVPKGQPPRFLFRQESRPVHIVAQWQTPRTLIPATSPRTCP